LQRCLIEQEDALWLGGAVGFVVQQDATALNQIALRKPPRAHELDYPAMSSLRHAIRRSSHGETEPRANKILAKINHEAPLAKIRRITTKHTNHSKKLQVFKDEVVLE
jgi:hypothetical protein